MRPSPGLVRELGLRDVVLFNVAAVVSIRWIATAARIGAGSLSLWIGAAVLFFVPLALAVARLNERFPREGGLYAWTGITFGEWHGFLCGWLYWLSNLFYLPNLLLAGIGIAFHTAGERYAGLAESHAVMTPVCLAVLWGTLLVNLVGVRAGKWTHNAGAAATCLAGAGILIAGILVYAKGLGATTLHAAPEWRWESLNYWSQIAFAFGGLELGANLSGEIRDSGRTVRRAAWISAAMISALYVAGTFAVLALLPSGQVSIVTGLAQAAQSAARRLGQAWLAPVLAGLVAIGVMGQFGAWLGGSARLAFSIGLDRYLPESFGRLHPRWKTPHVALLWQGAACSVALLALSAGENLRAAYQLLVDMTVITYFIPFLYLFAAAWRQGHRWSAASGALVTLVGIACSFVPPEGTRSVWLFEAKLAASCGVLAGLAAVVFRRGARDR
ncbi:MAG: APC family permease [Bryobacterales bacterium]|nr:APC family permease [Bryobacterales bacterium]